MGKKLCGKVPYSDHAMSLGTVWHQINQ